MRPPGAEASQDLPKESSSDPEAAIRRQLRGRRKRHRSTKDTLVDSRTRAIICSRISFSRVNRSTISEHTVCALGVRIMDVLADGTREHWAGFGHLSFEEQRPY